MSKIVDARGLSCPQPVLETLSAITASPEAEGFEVLVDSDTSVENITRAVKSKGWEVREVKEKDDGYTVVIGKK